MSSLWYFCRILCLEYISIADVGKEMLLYWLKKLVSLIDTISIQNTNRFCVFLGMKPLPVPGLRGIRKRGWRRW